MDLAYNISLHASNPVNVQPVGFVIPNQAGQLVVLVDCATFDFANHSAAVMTQPLENSYCLNQAQIFKVPSAHGYVLKLRVDPVVHAMMQLETDRERGVIIRTDPVAYGAAVGQALDDGSAHLASTDIGHLRPLLYIDSIESRALHLPVLSAVENRKITVALGYAAPTHPEASEADLDDYSYSLPTP
eukprot:2175083-Rhodomonas_salina.1